MGHTVQYIVTEMIGLFLRKHGQSYHFIKIPTYSAFINVYLQNAVVILQIK